MTRLDFCPVSLDRIDTPLPRFVPYAVPNPTPMSPNRRDFVKASAAIAAVTGARAAFGQPITLPAPPSDSVVDDLALEALNAAQAAGASYADARIGRYRRQSINTRERNVSGVSDSCLLYTSPSPRDRTRSRMPSSA